MIETLKMMKSIVVGNEKERKMNELVLEYCDKLSPNILAFLFVENFGLITQISANYRLLTQEDVASYALQELDNCLRTFDLTKNIQFNTYFGTCLKNKLRHEQQFLTTQLQYANYCIKDLNDYQEIKDNNLDLDYFDIENYNLTGIELAQCKLLMNGFNNKEIAKYFNITPQAVSYRNKNIGKKLTLDF